MTGCTIISKCLFVAICIICMYIMYILKASWKISYYMYAKCSYPQKIKSLLTYFLTYNEKVEAFLFSVLQH